MAAWNNCVPEVLVRGCCRFWACSFLFLCNNTKVRDWYIKPFKNAFKRKGPRMYLNIIKNGQSISHQPLPSISVLLYSIKVLASLIIMWFDCSCSQAIDCAEKKSKHVPFCCEYFL